MQKACLSSLMLFAMLVQGIAPSLAEEAPAKKEPAAKSKVVTVFTAASLKEPMETIATQYEKENGIKIQLSMAGSNQLATQIIEGAPADLFISASKEWMQKITQANLVTSEKMILGNRLVIVKPKDSKVTIIEPRDLIKPEVKKLALAGEGVPAGKYAEQALKKLDIFQTLIDSGKVVRGSDVRVTLTYVDRAEVEAGIVYATDARISKSVEVACQIEDSLHEPIRYPMALLKHAEPNNDAAAFFEHLKSQSTKDVFKAAGFTIIE